MQETWVQSLGQEDPLEKEMQYFCLENPMDIGACWATVHGVAKSWTQLSDYITTNKLVSKQVDKVEIHINFWYYHTLYVY